MGQLKGRSGELGRILAQIGYYGYASLRSSAGYLLRTDWEFWQCFCRLSGAEHGVSVAHLLVATTTMIY